MRIISGKYKRRLLNYPKDKADLRPTKDMVKEAVFSILQNKVPDCTFLDLFAGVGSIGLEAVSRGAQEVVFIEQNPKYIFENVALLKCEERLRIYKNDVLRAIEILSKKQELFDVIYCDPPYASELVEATLKKLKCFNILKKDGIIVVETASNKTILNSDFKLLSEKKYGSTKLLILEQNT